ncbi:MAG: peptidylprolyl isomerase [Verrucomicrobiota bacterium]
MGLHRPPNQRSRTETGVGSLGRIAATTAPPARPTSSRHHGRHYRPLRAGGLAATRPGKHDLSRAGQRPRHHRIGAGFAPQHVANVKRLARELYFDGLAIIRVQDNYVVQWADPNAETPAAARPIRTGQKTLPPEFDRALDPQIPFTRLPDGDVYAPEVGFSDGFPIARDPRNGRMWLVHSYGMVGAGRDNPADSGGGTELYAVIGQAPRHLDRNVTLLGRVLQGMELLSALPRGPGPMGFYDRAEQRIPIRAMRVAADVPERDRVPVQVMRTDTATFQALVESRRNRPEEWFKVRAGRIEIANVPVPVRKATGGGRSR